MNSKGFPISNFSLIFSSSGDALAIDDNIDCSKEFTDSAVLEYSTISLPTTSIFNNSATFWSYKPF